MDLLQRHILLHGASDCRRSTTDCRVTAVYMLDAGLLSQIIIVSNENFNHRGIIIFSIHNIWIFQLQICRHRMTLIECSCVNLCDHILWMYIDILLCADDDTKRLALRPKNKDIESDRADVKFRIGWWRLWWAFPKIEASWVLNSFRILLLLLYFYNIFILKHELQVTTIIRNPWLFVCGQFLNIFAENYVQNIRPNEF